MIRIENVDVHGIARAVYSSRNAKNSWAKSDSDITSNVLGAADLELAMKLAAAGSDHAKFLRMITAPLYWWKEADTYKVGTVTNSCSTMHTITEKEFTLDDFSHDRLLVDEKLEAVIGWLNEYRDLYVNWDGSRVFMNRQGARLERKGIWWQVIQLLPSSYNQRRTWRLNYQVLKNIYHARKTHKLDEWQEFCRWIEQLPYAKELICE